MVDTALGVGSTIPSVAHASLDSLSAGGGLLDGEVEGHHAVAVGGVSGGVGVASLSYAFC